MKRNRLIALAVIFLVLALIILIRLFELQVVHYDFYIKKAELQRTRIIPLSADRGDILDRNGRILAASLDTFSVYVNPRKFSSAEALAKLLGEPVGPFDKRKLFAWVKRKIDKPLADKIKKAEIPAVYLLSEKKRVYPKGHLASQILGFVGLDNEGLSGIELSLDKFLKGKEGQIVTESDPMGYELLVAKDRNQTEVSPGMIVTLTIDESIQYLAEKVIAGTIKQFGAAKGQIIVMDLKTGEILALAGKPDFNPNEYSKFDPKSWRSAAVDVYEPGSTFKVITAAAGLDQAVVNPDTKLRNLDSIELGGKTIKNSHQIKWQHGYQTISEMLEQSINTGAVQVALKLGPERFYKKIRDFGFGEKLSVDLPGESAGLLKEPRRWYKPDIGMMSFGQTLAVTPVQLLAAVASLANGGQRLKPILVKRIESPDGSFVRTKSTEMLNRTVTARTAEEAKKLMENVVLFGTGRRTKMSRYRTGGKTGTAQKAVPGGGYYKDRFVASYVGFAPYKDPRLCALVIVDDPRASIWGESVAGPAFKTVVEETLRYLNVPPDLRYNTTSKP